jgi:hypothetical protein
MTDEEGYCQRRPERIHALLVWGRAPSPVQAERSSAAAGGHGNFGLVMVGGFFSDRRGYVLLGADCSPSIAAFTFAETASVSCTVNPAVEIGSPTRISSGWHLMW